MAITLNASEATKASVFGICLFAQNAWGRPIDQVLMISSGAAVLGNKGWPSGSFVDIREILEPESRARLYGNASK